MDKPNRIIETKVEGQGIGFSPGQGRGLPNFSAVPFYRGLEPKNRERLQSKVSKLNDELNYRVYGWRSEDAHEIVSLISLSFSRFTLFLDEDIFENIHKVSLYEDAFAVRDQMQHAYIETYPARTYLLNCTGFLLGMAQFIRAIELIFPDGSGFDSSHPESARRYSDFAGKIERLRSLLLDFDRIKPTEKTAAERITPEMYGVGSLFLSAAEDLSFVLRHERGAIFGAARAAESRLLDGLMAKLEALARLVDRQQSVFRGLKPPFYVLKFNVRNVLPGMLEPRADGRDTLMAYFLTALLKMIDPDRCAREPSFISSFGSLSLKYFSDPAGLEKAEKALYSSMTAFYGYVPPGFEPKWAEEGSRRLKELLAGIVKIS